MFIKKDFISRLCTIEDVLIVMDEQLDKLEKRVKKLEGKKVKNE